MMMFFLGGVRAKSLHRHQILPYSYLAPLIPRFFSTCQRPVVHSLNIIVTLLDVTPLSVPSRCGVPTLRLSPARTVIPFPYNPFALCHTSLHLCDYLYGDNWSVGCRGFICSKVGRECA